jgi:hypothetical protein
MTVPLKRAPIFSVPIPLTRSHQNHAAVTCNGNHHDWFAKNILASGRASATKQPAFRLPGAVPPKHSRVLGCLGAGTVWGGHMDQISIKTPNPKHRLHWCEFVDWTYTQSCWYFRPLLWTSAPLTFSLVYLPHFPLPCVNKYRGIFIQCVKGGEGIGGLRQINTCCQAYLLVNF